jgi:response regulator RpfG family c-di-GMP phosphodiesterase
MSGYMEGMQNVLVAEDDDEDFELFAEAIRDLSLKVILERAENGDILMKILHEQIPDLLFLDVLMPCKNGKDCLFEIRSHRKFDDLPIVVYSSVRDSRSVEFFYRQRTNLYVFKPQTYRQLVAALEKIFAVDWKQVRYYPKYADFVLDPASAGN